MVPTLHGFVKLTAGCVLLWRDLTFLTFHTLNLLSRRFGCSWVASWDFFCVHLEIKTWKEINFKTIHLILIAAKFSRRTDKRWHNRTLEALFGLAELATPSLHSWRKAFICRRYQSPPTVHLFYTPKRIFHTASFCNRGASALLKAGPFSQWLHL